jgi:hypothetical protein
MAGAALSDDVALCSAAIAGLCRVLVNRGLLRPHELTLVAASAGLSEGQAGQFARGELTLAPHQTLTLVVAAFERLRVMQVSAAESRASSAPVPVPAETTEEGAQAAVAALAKDFGGWRFPLPDGIESIGTDRVKLIWRARHTGTWPDVAAVTAAELRGKLERIEASLAADERIQEKYRSGAGVSRR